MDTCDTFTYLGTVFLVQGGSPGNVQLEPEQIPFLGLLDGYSLVHQLCLQLDGVCASLYGLVVVTESDIQT